MVKVMLFIDGTWLYANLPRISEAAGSREYQVDFGALPEELSIEVSDLLHERDTDVVRTCLFGSYPSNFDLGDEDTVQRKKDFFAMLSEEHNYDVELFPVNFRGRHLRRADRDPSDSFEPKDKAADMALASSMVYYAAMPGAYDIALLLAGDQGFKTALRHVRRLGKRVVIASIKGSCSAEYTDPRDHSRVRDFDVIWIDDMLDRIKLDRSPQEIECQSPSHEGDRKVMSTFRPRKGRKFYCDECRERFARQKREAHSEFVSSSSDPHGADTDSANYGRKLTGVVNKVVKDRGYAFIMSPEGAQYFFHFSDLRAGLDFEDVIEGLYVDFEIKRDPGPEKAGAAMNVQLHVD